MTEEQKQENRLRIGGQVAAIRNKKGLSIRELAEACGVSFANVYKIENGKYNVSIDILGKICEALDCRLEIIENTTDDNYISKNLMPKKGDVIIITKKRGVLGSIKVGNKYEVHDAWERDWRGKIVKTVIFYEVNSRGVKVRKGIRDVSYDWDIVEE